MKNRFFYLAVLSSFLYACSSNPLDIDVSEVTYELECISVVDAFESANTIEEFKQVNIDLNTQAKVLYEYYTSEMLRVGMPLQDSTPVFLSKFIKDSTMMIVNEKIKNAFGDFSNSKENVINMFKHLKYHIPNAMMPSKLLIYNSTFSNGVISTPDFIGLGLEMYLGPQDDIVQKVPFPEYFKKKMNAEFLCPDIAQSWLESNVLESNSETSFLSNLIYYGKLLYVIKAMLPSLPDHLILRYYNEEWQWAQDNEYGIWQYIVQDNLVYDTKMKTMLRYFKPAPTTTGFDGSPDRLGQYLGFQIVSSYMSKNTSVTVKELVAEQNNSKILKSYKPKQ
ncbi:MAG: hypothetical protein AB8B74_10390 [Crocinitomicaceae bacterium]